MKKLILTTAAVILIGTCFCGCGNVPDSKENTPTATSHPSTMQITILPTTPSSTEEFTNPTTTVLNPQNTETSNHTTPIPTEVSKETPKVQSKPIHSQNTQANTPTTSKPSESVKDTIESAENLTQPPSTKAHLSEEETPTEETFEITQAPTNPAEQTPPYVSEHVYTQMEIEVFELINQERVNVGLSPLTLSSTYADCAQIRAEEAKIVWSHTRPDGTSYYTVLNTYNLQNSYALIGENLARGFRTAEQVMRALMKSEGHRNNILNPDVTSVSVGIVPMNDSGQYVLSQLFVKEK